MCPQKKRDASLAALKRLRAKMPPGLIIFDRGFNRRKVFTTILGQGHHLLCRAKSNAVFYHIPKQPKQPKQGRPRRYGNRLHLLCLKSRDIVVKDKTLSVADLERPVAELIQHYKNRWQIETAFREVKQNFGCSTHQLQKRKSLNRFAQLSFVAATLTQLIFTNTASETKIDDVPLDVAGVLRAPNMHWSQAKYLTRGLMTAYLQHCFRQQCFSASYDAKQNSKKNLKIVEDSA